MRSLFAKIVVWFLATLIVTLVATIVVIAFTYSPYSSRPAPLSMLVTMQMQEARRAYESGGPEALKAALARFRAVVDASDAFLTDANGRDLVTGDDHSALVREIRAWKRYPFFGRRGRTTFARISPDGRFWYFLMAGERNWYLWYLQPAHLLVLLLAVVMCGGLAYYLTAPLRRLRRAVDRFGRGDLDARAEAGRRDEIGELASTFNQMADRIQTLLAAERRLLLDISHELRSPLARLSVAVELARGGAADALPLDRIQKEADRLNALVGELLEVTRVEGDPSQRRLERVRLDELLGDVADACSIEAQARGCSLALAKSGEVTVQGDPELLRRAVENVVRNAIRYAPRESTVEMGMSNGEKRVTVRVRDYGPGVPADALPRLFDAFYRVEPDRNRSRGGAGLGLSIARRAIELHKGALRARNAEPGLEVEIELPA